MDALFAIGSNAWFSMKIHAVTTTTRSWTRWLKIKVTTFSMSWLLLVLSWWPWPWLLWSSWWPWPWSSPISGNTKLNISGNTKIHNSGNTPFLNSLTCCSSWIRDLVMKMMNVIFSSFLFYALVNVIGTWKCVNPRISRKAAPAGASRPPSLLLFRLFWFPLRTCAGTAPPLRRFLLCNRLLHHLATVVLHLVSPMMEWTQN